MDAIETEVLEEASSAIEKDSESTVDSVTTTSAQHVINLLLQSQATGAGDSQAVSLPPGLQSITLPDGTTAIMQQSNVEKDGDKLSDNQSLQLEGVDGSATVVQTLKTNNQNEVAGNSEGANQFKFQDGQAIQLEDGTTAYIHHTSKEGVQAIRLEDGSTAYIAQGNAADQIFGEGNTLDPSALQLDSFPGVGQQDGPQTVTLLTGKEQGKMQSAVFALVEGDGQVNPMARGFKCTYEGCGRLYTTHHHLKVHERTHTGDKPFRCEYQGCNKAFATGYGLKSHLRVHTGEKPYKCPEEHCDKAFKTSGDLQKHVRTHTGERPFKCPFEGCDRSFTTSNIRKVHIRTHTGERPYICQEPDCGRSFASATNYKNHARIHTGEKPYVCTVQGCNKRFTEYSSLYKHHVVHTHSKPYECNYCGRTYRQTSTLAMHKRTAHGEVDGTVNSDQVIADAVTSVAVPPPEKRARVQYSSSQDLPLQPPQATPTPGPEDEEGTGTLVINTADPSQAITIVSSEGMGVVSQGVVNQNLVHAIQTTQLHGNMPFQVQTTSNSGEQEQQIFVVTDPAQLELLKQLAQQQQLNVLQPQSGVTGEQFVRLTQGGEQQTEQPDETDMSGIGQDGSSEELMASDTLSMNVTPGAVAEQLGESVEDTVTIHEPDVSQNPSVVNTATEITTIDQADVDTLQDFTSE